MFALPRLGSAGLLALLKKPTVPFLPPALPVRLPDLTARPVAYILGCRLAGKEALSLACQGGAEKEEGRPPPMAFICSRIPYPGQPIHPGKGLEPSGVAPVAAEKHRMRPRIRLAHIL